MVPPPDFSSLSSSEKDALIRTLLARVDALIAENAALCERLNLPPKTPGNSSTPPSQGHKASGEGETKPKAKSHAGFHRPLHPTPTRRRDVLADRCGHCRADVSAVSQTTVHAYDRIEIPEIVPDVTRVTLHGGVCPCCARRFKAAAPEGLEPGSPFGPNLRAFVLYLRFAQAIPFERLARLMSDLLGLEISEGALANMLEASGSAVAQQTILIRDRLLSYVLGLEITDGSLANMLEASGSAFAPQTSLIRARLLSGTILQSDETSARVGKKTWWTWVFHNAD